MRDGSNTGKSEKEIMAEYHELGAQLANMLAAHVRQSRSLCATFTTEDPAVVGGPLDGRIEYVILIARQYPFSGNPTADTRPMPETN